MDCIPTVADVFAFGGLESIGALPYFLGDLVGTLPGGVEFARVDLPSVLKDLAKDPVACFESFDSNIVVVVSGGLLLIDCVADIHLLA